VLLSIAPVLLSQERLIRGLHQLVAYLHSNGVTAFNEPGIVWEMEPWDPYQSILGADDVPFLSIFANHVKLFADGTIISQLMQMRDGYLGLDVVLDAIEACMISNPRADHRSVVVHFATSTEEQVDRIARLGAIVSANPYYPCGFADKYAEHGLGPERADTMVRARSVLDRHLPLSFHSDLPMAPAEPLKLAWCAVNRRTQSGRVAGPEQCISVDAALRAVTVEAAYSWRREHDLGSIAPGKRATFTVLAADPYDIDPNDLDRIRVLGTVFEGQWHPVPDRGGAGAVHEGIATLPGHISAGTLAHPENREQHGCCCEAARRLADAFRRSPGR